ncbi:MAG: hypothetical protein ACRDJI_11360 [Actinomycetota bacterium]
MGETYDERVEKLAHKLLHGGDGNDSGATDIETARRTARRMIEDSEARTAQASELDPDDDDVIRRSSGETAAIGESSHPQVSDGE